MKASTSASRPALYAICAGFFLVLLDASSVNVAIAEIGRNLGASVGALSWVLNGYTVVLAACLMSCGAVGDRVGAKRLYLWGLALSTLMSLASALAPDIRFLIGARVLQGLGAAMMIPGSLALLNHAFPEPKEMAQAVGFWAGIVSLGFALGPFLGGVLVHMFGWRGVFWLEAPLGALAFWMTLRFVAETRETDPQPMDWAGQSLLFVTLLCLTYALIEAGSKGWTAPPILASFGIAAVSGIAFLRSELRSRAPALPPKLFAQPLFSACVAVGAVVNFSMYGILFIESLRLQNSLHIGAFRTGLIILPATLLPTVTIRLLTRYDNPEYRKTRLIAAQCVGACGALILFLALGHRSLGPVLLGLGLLGVCMGCTTPAITSGALACAPLRSSGTASAILNAFRQIGSTLGVALMGALVESSPGPGQTRALALGFLVFLGMAGILWKFVPKTATEKA
ncbi:MAG: MFS transporter [bacterium]